MKAARVKFEDDDVGAAAFVDFVFCAMRGDMVAALDRWKEEVHNPAVGRLDDLAGDAGLMKHVTEEVARVKDEAGDEVDFDMVVFQRLVYLIRRGIEEELGEAMDACGRGKFGEAQEMLEWLGNRLVELGGFVADMEIVEVEEKGGEE